MSGPEILQISFAAAGVVVGGGIWFKLGALTAALKAAHEVTTGLRDRIQRLENHVFLERDKS